VPGLGFLEGNMSGDVRSDLTSNSRAAMVIRAQMKQGSKVELPLWLGEMLALR
jgi:hypothetical protein